MFWYFNIMILLNEPLDIICRLYWGVAVVKLLAYLNHCSLDVFLLMDFIFQLFDVTLVLFCIAYQSAYCRELQSIGLSNLGMLVS